MTLDLLHPPRTNGIYRTTHLKDLIDAKVMLGYLDNYYPGFNEWYDNKVLTQSTKPSLIVLVSRSQGFLNAVAIGKLTDKETKLRCVRVHPESQNSGLGFRMIERMFDYLNTDRPHCTVAQEMFHLYSRAFINRYGFDLTHVAKGQYREQKLEYFFN